MGKAGFLLVGERGQSPFYPLSGMKFGRRYGYTAGFTLFVGSANSFRIFTLMFFKIL